MVLPITILIAIPIFLGIVYAPPFDLPEKPDEQITSEEHDPDILYFMLIVIWVIVLLRILLQMKKGAFKITQKY